MQIKGVNDGLGPAALRWRYFEDARFHGSVEVARVVENDSTAGEESVRAAGEGPQRGFGPDAAGVAQLVYRAKAGVVAAGSAVDGAGAVEDDVAILRNSTVGASGEAIQN